MARHRGPKHKLAVREGANLTGTTSPSLQRKLDARALERKRRRASGYEARLRAKQRVKLQYGLLERQFRRMYREALKMPGRRGESLLQLLERRLDNTLYRLGLARTRPMARQLVNHGHVLVNGRKMNIPSYIVKLGDVISLSPKAMQMPLVQEELGTARAIVPSWLVREAEAGRVVGTPKREEIDADIREDLIVEYYAR
jgi:small subunit ribosomal protein S4